LATHKVRHWKAIFVHWLRRVCGLFLHMLPCKNSAQLADQGAFINNWVDHCVLNPSQIKSSLPREYIKSERRNKSWGGGGDGIVL
jgi:hypothetical protein